MSASKSCQNRPFRKSQFQQKSLPISVSVSMKKFIEIPFPSITFYSVPSNHSLSTIWALYTTPKVGIDCVCWWSSRIGMASWRPCECWEGINGTPVFFQSFPIFLLVIIKSYNLCFFSQVSPGLYSAICWMFWSLGCMLIFFWGGVERLKDTHVWTVFQCDEALPPRG